MIARWAVALLFWYIAQDAAMAERLAKRRQLNDFRRRVPYVSMSALSAVLQDIEEHGAPEINSRRSMDRAVSDQLRMATPYGSLLTELNLVSAKNQNMTIPAINPLGLLVVAYEQGGNFTNLFDKAYRASPPTMDEPWRLIIYGDEVTPGNVIAVNNLKKIWVIYFSFQELGMIALQCEEAWFTLIVCRSNVVGTVDAGISQIYGQAVKLFFGALGANMMTGGIVLRRQDGSQIRLWAKLNMLLQDGGAHKLVFHCEACLKY